MINYTETDWQRYQRRKERIERLEAMEARLNRAMESCDMVIILEHNPSHPLSEVYDLLKQIRDGKDGQ